MSSVTAFSSSRIHDGGPRGAGFLIVRQRLEIIKPVAGIDVVGRILLS